MMSGGLKKPWVGEFRCPSNPQVLLIAVIVWLIQPKIGRMTPQVFKTVELQVKKGGNKQNQKAGDQKGKMNSCI